MKKTICIPLIFVIPIGIIGVFGIAFLGVLNSPEILTPLMEWGVSNITHSQVTIDQVEVIEHPFGVKLKQLRFNFDPKLPQSAIDIDTITLHFSFSGPLGRKTLWIENLRIDALKATFNSDAKLPKFLSSTASNDSAPGLFRTILAALTFKEVRLKSIERINGHVVYYSKHKRVELSKIDLSFDQASIEKAPLLKGRAVASIFDNQKDLELPKGLLDFTATFTPFENKRTLLGEINLTADNLRIKGAKLTAVNAHMLIDYDHAKKGLKIILDLYQNRYAFKYKESLLKGNLGGSFEIKGTWPDRIEYIGRLESQATDVFAPKLKLNSAKVACQFQGRYPELLIKELIFQIPSMKLAFSKPLELKNIDLHAGKVNWNLKSFSGQIPALQIDSDSFKSVVIGIDHTPLTTKVDIDANQASLINTLQMMALLPRGWEVSAKEALRANLVFDKNRDVMDWQVRLALKALTFESNDQTVMAENLAPVVKANGKLTLDNFTISGQAALNCDVGEVLIGQLYTNFEDHGFNLMANFDYSPATQKVDIKQGSFELDKLLKAAFSIKRNRVNNRTEERLHIVIPATDLSPLYNFAVKEPFELDVPTLSTTKITGTFEGKIDFIVEDDQWEVKGDWLFENGSVMLAEKKVKLKGIQLNLPVWITSRHLSDRKESSLKGTLFLGSMKVPFLAAQSLQLPLMIRPNKILFPKKTSFKGQDGGLIHLWPLTMNFGTSKGLRLGTRIDLDNFQFDAGLKRWWPSQGPLKINANLGPVRIEGQTLSSKGRLSTQLFGGDLTISNLKVVGLFSSTPVFGMDIMVDGVDLADLTDQTSFGKIDGILKGRIENLEIANNQLQRFNLRLETVPQKGIPQKISVKAVESIARIGGGQSPFIGLAGRFATLFRKFNYRKIGIAASLENDLFSINGLVHEKGQEYLVKKSGLSGVDVVNSNPDNRIGFKDMVKRIRRVLNPHAQPVVQ